MPKKNKPPKKPKKPKKLSTEQEKEIFDIYTHILKHANRKNLKA